MSATIGTADREQLHDPEELPIELARYTLTTSNGTAKLSEADWPTWPVRPADGMSSAESALSGVRRYWNKSGYRQRDPAKWAGNPVTFTVDRRGISICSISGSAVTLNQPGLCLIDANQVGNAKYRPVPQVQQAIAVQPSVPSPTTSVPTTLVPTTSIPIVS
jgi:hypothetical protein